MPSHVTPEPTAVVELVRAAGAVLAAAVTALGARYAVRAHRRSTAQEQDESEAHVGLRDDQLVRVVEESLRVLQEAMKEERKRSSRLEEEVVQLRREGRDKDDRIAELSREQHRLREELKATRRDLAETRRDLTVATGGRSHP